MSAADRSGVYVAAAIALIFIDRDRIMMRTVPE
jgi:hypothetical protein